MCDYVSFLMTREREALIVLHVRLKGRLSPWAASASLIAQVLARSTKLYVEGGPQKKGKAELGDQVFVPRHFAACCQLFP